MDAETVEKAEALITAELCDIEKSTLPQSSTNEAYAQAVALPPIQYQGPFTLIPPQMFNTLKYRPRRVFLHCGHQSKGHKTGETGHSMTRVKITIR